MWKFKKTNCILWNISTLLFEYTGKFHGRTQSTGLPGSAHTMQNKIMALTRLHIPVHTVAARSRLRSADHGDLVVLRVLSRFGCRSFRVSGPTIWNDLPVDFRSTDITHEQFKRSLKSWLFECAYGRRRVWETVQSEGAPKKWTYLLTYSIVSKFTIRGRKATQAVANLRDEHSTHLTRHILSLLSLMLRRIEDWSLHWPYATRHCWTRLSTATLINTTYCSIFNRHFSFYKR